MIEFGKLRGGPGLQLDRSDRVKIPEPAKKGRPETSSNRIEMPTSNRRDAPSPEPEEALELISMPKVVTHSNKPLGDHSNDIEHGNRGGGPLHNVAQTDSNGFMSAADKVKLDTVSAGGTFTLAAAATKVVSDVNATATCQVLLFPTNAAAAVLMSGVKMIYVTSRSAGVSFTVSTADGTAAAGTETFAYRILL